LDADEVKEEPSEIIMKRVMSAEASSFNAYAGSKNLEILLL
jgi:hypothetical protein